MTRTTKYYLNKIIWPWSQRSSSHEGRYGTRHMSWMILLKKYIYLTLRSKVKVPRGHYGTQHSAWWSCTHMPISLTYLQRQKCYGQDKKILFKKQLFDVEVIGQGPTKVITVRDIPPYDHAPTNYLPMNSFAGFIWPWGQMSRSHEGHDGRRHTVWSSCTHMPNIIDLSRTTKMLWPGQ